MKRGERKERNKDKDWYASEARRQNNQSIHGNKPRLAPQRPQAILLLLSRVMFFFLSEASPKFPTSLYSTDQGFQGQRDRIDLGAILLLSTPPSPSPPLMEHREANSFDAGNSTTQFLHLHG